MGSAAEARAAARGLMQKVRTEKQPHETSRRVIIGSPGKIGMLVLRENVRGSDAALRALVDRDGYYSHKCCTQLFD